MFGYFKSLIKSGSGESSKSFALVISAVIGGLIGLCIAFVLIYDTIKNGSLQTDLDKLGIFILCVGGFMFGGGANKALSERGEAKKKIKEGEN